MRSGWRWVSMVGLTGLLVAAVGGVWAANPAGAKGAPRVFTKAPYLQCPGSNTITIRWESLTNVPGVVSYGEGRQLDRATPPVVPRAFEVVTSKTTNVVTVKPAAAVLVTNKATIHTTNVWYLYEVRLTDLEPRTLYTYGVELAGVRTPPKQWRTLGSARDPVTFIAYGDSRSQPKVHAALAKGFKAHRPDFLLHTGDLVEVGKDYARWSKEFFEPLAEVLDEVPTLAEIGNHEGDATNYLALVSSPGQERWYACDAGPVHLLALDYHFTKTNHAQYAFARRDLLTSRAPWKIVLVHYPVFNIGGHITAWGHDSYLPLFREAKVDLIISGHSHLYERFLPVAPRATPRAWPLLQLITGGGGAELHAAFPHPALAQSASTNHFVVIRATPDLLQAEAFLTHGARLDAFELRKPAAATPAQSLARAYPEEGLQMMKRVATNWTAKLAALPGTNQPVYVEFALSPAKGFHQKVQLEISPAPLSAASYELLEGPLRLDLPTAGQSNQVVWARVRATGLKKAKEGKDREALPRLAFQARATWEGGETVAYTLPLQVSKTTADTVKKLGLP